MCHCFAEAVPLAVPVLGESRNDPFVVPPSGGVGICCTVPDRGLAASADEPLRAAVEDLIDTFGDEYPDALFGAETSGHYFFRALQGGDDGLYAACQMIACLALSDRTLSQLRCECPQVFITPDLSVSVAQEHQQTLIDRVRAAWSDHPQKTIDGVRIDFPDGWALIRSSVTEAALTFRFEAADPGWLSELVRRFCDGLDEVVNELRAQFEAAMEGRG